VIVLRRSLLIALAALLVSVAAHGYDGSPDAKAVVAHRQSSRSPAVRTGNYRNRSFDPATGRFLQRDPVLGGDPTFNPYCFPGNNPVTNAAAPR
jgi:RHS repeat-associated protein